MLKNVTEDSSHYLELRREIYHLGLHIHTFCPVPTFPLLLYLKFSTESVIILDLLQRSLMS